MTVYFAILQPSLTMIIKDFLTIEVLLEETPGQLLKCGNSFQLFYFVLRSWIEQFIELYAEIMINEPSYGM